MPKTATSKKIPKKTKVSPKVKVNSKANSHKKLPTKAQSIQLKSIAGPLSLSAKALKLIWRYNWLFGGIIIIYGVINLAVALGFSGGLNVASLKNQLSYLFHGGLSSVYSGLTIYGLLIVSGNNGSSTPSGGSGIEIILIIMVSLALVYALRNSINKSEVSIRTAYYRGMYPLVPVILVLIVLALELLPMVVGVGLYAAASQNGIVTTVIENIVFIFIAALLSALTIYWLSSSLFALYIVTLPEMTPLKALKSAKKLVKKRRLPIILRLLYLPIVLLVLSLIVMLPIIILAAPIAQWAFRVLSLALLVVAHSYLYHLYRELLEE